MGNSMGRSPELEQRRGGRAMDEGGGGQRLAVGACFSVREVARRMVWGEVRCGTAGAPFYWGRREAQAAEKGGQ
jgi:hypothetical protein